MKLVRLAALGYALTNPYLWPAKVAASIVNRTIDDQLGDSTTGLLPIYSPAGNIWNNQTCSGTQCPIKPNVTQTFHGTYTAGTYYPGMGSMGISMQFTGTAIYVFFILPNPQEDGVTTLTSANFTVDGEAPVLFTHTSVLPPTSFQYNALVFSQSKLSNTLHTLKITATGSTSVYLNFDYAIYTHDDSATSSLSAPAMTPTLDLQRLTISVKALVGAIFGGIVGGVVFVFVILLLFRWHRRGGHGFLQRSRVNRIPTPLITEFNGPASGLAVSAPGIPDTKPPAVPPPPAPPKPLPPIPLQLQPQAHSTADSEASTAAPQLGIHIFNSWYSTEERGRPSKRHPHPRSPAVTDSAERDGGTWNVLGMLYAPDSVDGDPPSNIQTLHSGEVVLTPPCSERLSSSVKKASASSTSNTRARDTSNNSDRSASTPLPTPWVSGTKTQEVSRARQEELDNQLRMVQHNIIQLEESRACSVRSVSLRRRTLREAGVTDEEADMSVPDMKEVIRLLREQIRVLKEQQQSAWAQGLSDDPPPGYTPMARRTLQSSPEELSQ